MLIIHAGDCGAVLSRNGVASRLTLDHKPDVPEERKRVLQAGGQISQVGSSQKERVLEPRRAGQGFILPKALNMTRYGTD